MIRVLRISQSLCLGGVLALAAGITCGILAAVGFSLYYELRRELVDVQSPGFYEQVRLLPDATPVIDRQDWYSGARAFLDQDRNRLDAEPDERFLESVRLASREHERRRFLYDRGRDAGMVYIGRVRGREDWFFISGDAPADRAYFVGYDVLARRLVGYIGAAGFQQQPIPARDQFRIDPHALAYGNSLIRNEGSVYLLSGSQLTFVDLDDRNVRELAAEVESMGSGSSVDVIGAESEPASDSRTFVAVRTQTHVEAWDWSGRLLGRYAIPAGWAPHRQFWFYLTASGDAVFSATGERPTTHEEHRESPVEFVLIGPAGEESTFAVVLHQPILQTDDVVSEELGLNVITAGVPAPVAAAGFALGLNPWARSTFGDRTFGEALSESTAATWPALLLVLFLAAGLTWLAYRRQQAHDLPQSFAWLAFVFVLGLPGYLGYRLHRRWPVREPVPPPALTGIEVLD